MKIVVTGAAGLLGSHLCMLYPDIIGLTKHDCDITNPEQVYDILNTIQPHVVINAAGIVPKHHENNTLDQFRVNGIAPRILAAACDDISARLIHISTDCVFAGNASEYYEWVIPNPKDMYGMSKVMGEIEREPHLTIRTSFVGYPDPNKRGLIAWLKEQTHCQGYTNYWWNGLTTVELAEILVERIIPSFRLSGLLHLSAAQDITKHDLLVKIRDFYGWEINIQPVAEPRINRLLRTEYSWQEFSSRSYDEMLERMRALL